MAKLNTVLHALTAGEVSTAALARIDHEKLRLAAEIQENLFPHVVGKGKFRPGNAYLGATASNNKARYLPFVKSPTDTALIEMTDSLMRVWIGDSLLTRSSVTSTVTNGDFSSSSGWTLTATSGASATISGGELTLIANARGSSCYCERAVTTSSAGTEHALRITVTTGPVRFRCGSSSGAEDYISETTLDTGVHSLAFTPTGTYYPRFIVRSDRRAIVDSIVVESSGVMTLTAPWSESDLPLIRFSQSIDTVFLACQSWQQRKIERRGSSGRSWSLVKYETDDGPFTSSATNQVKVTLSAGYGIATLTASAGIFTSNHVGSLMRIFPRGQGVAVQLAGSDVYSESVRLTGIGSTNDLAYAVTGTWVGTISVQYSFEDNDDIGFSDAGTQHTVNASGTATVGTEYDNVTFYVRYGFKPGDYTSGIATVYIGNDGGGKAGVVRIVGYTSATEVTVQVLSPPGSLNATDNWQWGAWSEVQGWPSAVALFDGRLWWGGEDHFWASESDDYYAFNLEDDGDAGSIQRSLATGGTINRVKWMLPLQRLIFGTDGAEISARSSSFDEPLTPTNITLKDASTLGAAAYSPVKLDGRGLYIHRDGVRSFEIVYDFEGNDYRAASLMLLNDTIGGDGFLGMAIQRSPETYIWHVRSDGQCACLIYDVREKTAGWFRFIAGASAAGAAVIEDVVVLPSSGPDRVYMVVKRTINGSPVRYLEKLAKHSEAEGGTGNRIADSYVYNAGPVTTFTGLSHLIGETVIAWGTYNGVTGIIGTTFTVNVSGDITLPGSCTDVTVGLAYDWRFKSAKLAYGAESTALLMPKRIDQLGLLTENTHPDAIRYGIDFTTMYKLPRVEGGQAFTETTVRAIYDEATFAFGGSWDTDSRLCLKGSAPYPATINAIVLGIETNET